MATALVLLVLPGGETTGPEQHVTFSSLPNGTKISAKLIPNAFGTEIHMYVKGVSSGTLCRVYLRSARHAALRRHLPLPLGRRQLPVLSSALDLSKTERSRCGSATAPSSPRGTDLKSHTQTGRHSNDKNPRRGFVRGGAGASPAAEAATAARRGVSAGGAYGGGAPPNRPRPHRQPQGSATVTVGTVPKLGKVIVDSGGFTLYDFHKDKGTTSSCYGECESSGRR